MLWRIFAARTYFAFHSRTRCQDVDAMGSAHTSASLAAAIARTQKNGWLPADVAAAKTKLARMKAPLSLAHACSC